jgi:hypothetical protein
MVRYLGAVLLMAVVTAAPIARTACEMTCAAQGNGAPTHSCHAHESSAGFSINGVHRCGHDDEQPASAGMTASPDAPAIAVIVIEPPALHTGPLAAHLRVVSHSPPGSSSLTPLRI